MKRKALLGTAALAATLGVFFQWIAFRAYRACDEISDQCADAGFAWEASGKLLIVGAAVLVLMAGLVTIGRCIKAR